MRLVTHLIALNREIRLRRQLADIERVVLDLPVRTHAELQQLVRREMEQAAACDFPHLYGTPPEERYSTYGHGPDIGLAKARSENPLIATRGVALWLAAVYHETLDARRPGAEELHRQILRLMRQIKELSVSDRRDAHSDWMPSRAAI
ncbi:hypothetical protein P3W24_05555 [Luteibacter sp. PPL201]|jgi:hypothetical protein|uniref:Uncharacterized protein n=1 Tax=Luteibacter sahnii TaxID=3021977 RepID=A0ABT6B8K3_9GAMM|nr:hypothetical protein [Luteibacter sp. PPL193]MDY1550065.1 hypothetical protein [Luteibacter sp. PPL193]